MNVEEIRDAYDQRAATYDASIGRSEKALTGTFRARFGALLQGSTLEVAIGSGLNLPYYTDHVTNSVGTDLSAGMLAIASNRARELQRPIELVIMDAQRLAFPDDTFDTVAISLALCTVPNPAAAIREMIRVCKPAGRIVLLEHVRSPIWPVALLQRLVSPIQERHNGCHLTRETIDLARECRLSIEREDRRLAGIFRLVMARPPKA